MKGRILSIDVLRGLIIFLMILVNTPGSWNYVLAPMRHAKWHGCTLTDLVFPGFLFVMGLAMSISFRKYDNKHRRQLFSKIVYRTTLIFILGLLLNWFPFFHKHISDLRIFGVLQRIALSYFLASVVLLYSKNWKFIAIVSTAFMLAHWGLLYYFGIGDPYSLEGNVAVKIDLFLIGESHMYQGFGQTFDPEGLLGTLTGGAQVLLGYLIGYQITSRSVDNDTVTFLIIAGALFLGIGLLWSQWLPLNKPLWTGSYVLYTTGILTLVLYGLTRIIDIHQKKKWTLPFQVFGLNPLISYIMSGVIVRILLYIIKSDETTGYAWLFERVFQPVFGDYAGSLLFAFAITGLVWLLAWVMYKNKIVIKV